MRLASAVVVVMISCLIEGVLDDRSVSAQECSGGSLRANLVSQVTQARLSISSKSYQCRLPAGHHGALTSESFYTYETLCSPNSQRGPGTLCSVAPCINRNQSFALRNLRHPDGHEDPAVLHASTQVKQALFLASPSLRYTKLSVKLGYQVAKFEPLLL